MKFLQFNISSTKISIDELWRHQQENNYDGIILQETNCTHEKLLGNFKHWKSKMYTIYKSKNAGSGVSTLIRISTKRVLRDSYINNDLGIVWNGMKIQKKDVLIANIYVTPGNEDQLKILDKELEIHRGKNMILREDFNSRNNTWDKNIQQ